MSGHYPPGASSHPVIDGQHARLRDREVFFPEARERPRDPFYVPACSCGWEGSAARPHGQREGQFVNHAHEHDPRVVA